MYKDKTKQREAVKKAVNKHRGITKGITESEGITSVPAIVTAITNPVTRKKLEAVCSSLKAYKGDVRYGCGKDSITFNTVGELLDIIK